MTATSPTIDAAVVEAAIEHGYDRGWSDGLPLVPATRPLVDRFLATTKRTGDEEVARLDHLGRVCTVELAAINAAMAGCRPEYLPVVLAALEAVMRDRAATGGGWQSTSGPAPLLVVNGPVRHRLGFNATGGVLGPGFRANATVARAIGLIVRNVFGVVPHELEQATQGVPGRWAQCIAENEEASPWPPLATEGGVPAGTDAVSAVLLRTSEFVDNRHTQDAEQLLTDLADTIGRSGAWIFRHAAAGLVLCPEHAHRLADAGYDRAALRRWLAANAGRPSRALAAAGKALGPDGRVRGASHELVDDDRFEHHLAGDAPEDLPIVVAGAANAGISMVVRVFTRWSATAVPIEDPPVGPTDDEETP